jgi:predicted DNA-binding transcriptional regulator AlpA
MAATKPKPVRPGQKYLNGVGELATFMGLHPHTCNKYIARGLLPKPRKPSSRKAMFVVAEVEAAIESWPQDEKVE